MGVEERRQQLLTVALELFSRHPPGEVSIEDIATAAGISRPLVYHYFPGKRALHDAALQRAADKLLQCFAELPEGPLGARLLRIVNRFFDFVDEHGSGFTALLRCGSAAVGWDGAGAVIDEVRQAAYDRILVHIDIEQPSPRMQLALRSWISLAETTALTWLDGRRIPRAELELQLVHSFVALAGVSAACDEDMTGVLRRLLAGEPANGAFDTLIAQFQTLSLQPS